jgi:hypothetical protein
MNNDENSILKSIFYPVFFKHTDLFAEIDLNFYCWVCVRVWLRPEIEIAYCLLETNEKMNDDRASVPTIYVREA